MRALNPRIILASVSGFGQTGPYRTRAGFDQIAQGMGGLMAVTGLPGQGPVRAGIAVADSAAGVYAAVGVLVALAERERSGEGQWVQTSLLQAMIAMMDFQAARYLVEGGVPPQAGNDHPYQTPMGVYATRDGHINIAVAAEGQWRKFCEAIGRPELGTDPAYDSIEKRFAQRPALRAIIEDVLRTQPSAEWIAVFEHRRRSGRADLRGGRGLRRSAGPAPRHRRARASPRAGRHPRGGSTDRDVAHAAVGRDADARARRAHGRDSGRTGLRRSGGGPPQGRARV